MLKRLAVAAFLVVGFVDQARPQVPGHGSEQKQSTDAHATQTKPTPERAGFSLEIDLPAPEKEQESKSKPYQWGELIAPANIPNWALTVAAIFASVFAYRTLRRIARQTDLMNRNNVVALASAKAAQKSAEVALKTAKAYMGAERAWVVIGSHMGKFQLQEDLEPCFIWSIKNAGRSPAQILETQCSYEWVRHNNLRSLPSIPEFNDPVFLNGLLLVLGDSKTYPRRLTGIVEASKTALVPLTLDHLNQLQVGTYVLRAHGFVRYTDAFCEAGETRESRFCEFYLAKATPHYREGFYQLLDIPTEYCKCT